MTKKAFEQWAEFTADETGYITAYYQKESAWNAAIDAAIASTKDVKIRNAGVWYAHEMAEKYNAEIQKLKSE